jgi:hypothetical protein
VLECDLIAASGLVHSPFCTSIETHNTRASLRPLSKIKAIIRNDWPRLSLPCSLLYGQRQVGRLDHGRGGSGYDEGVGAGGGSVGIWLRVTDRGD